MRKNKSKSPTVQTKKSHSKSTSKLIDKKLKSNNQIIIGRIQNQIEYSENINQKIKVPIMLKSNSKLLSKSNSNFNSNSISISEIFSEYSYINIDKLSQMQRHKILRQMLQIYSAKTLYKKLIAKSYLVSEPEVYKNLILDAKWLKSQLE